MTSRRRGIGDPPVPWAGKRCMALTTFRADGSSVTTPVWFVADGPELRLWTGARTAKVKRVRNDPRCILAPCTMSGRVTGPTLNGRARELPIEEGARVQQLLRAKYPIQKRALDVYAWLRRRGHPSPPGLDAYLAVTVVP
ncbi:MAG: PPOX class F420-dependent oxidoreductase [Streptosporangiaceae bacterium]